MISAFFGIPKKMFTPKSPLLETPKLSTGGSSPWELREGIEAILAEEGAAERLVLGRCSRGVQEGQRDRPGGGEELWRCLRVCGGGVEEGSGRLGGDDAKKVVLD